MGELQKLMVSFQFTVNRTVIQYNESFDTLPVHVNNLRNVAII